MSSRAELPGSRNSPAQHGSSLPLLLAGLLVAAFDSGWVLGVLSGVRRPTAQEVVLLATAHALLIVLALSHEAQGFRRRGFHAARATRRHAHGARRATATASAF